MNPKPLTTEALFWLGPVPISKPVVTTWAIMILLACISWVLTRRRALRPSRGQFAAELFVATLRAQVREVIRRDPDPFLPLLGTLFLYIAIVPRCPKANVPLEISAIRWHH